jgi:transglutaminase-like putative cysteine protease
MAIPLTCLPDAETAARPILRYGIEDRFTVAELPREADAVDIWCPLISDSPYQRVLGMELQASAPWTLGRDPEHGNPMLHARLVNPLPPELDFRLGYVVERRALAHMLDPACVGPLATPALFALALRAEQFVDVDETTRELARDVIRGETNLLGQARRIYDYVTGTMSYDAAKQSWKGSTEHALACSVGNCNDIHALLISLCRSVGIPARLVMGQALELPPPGEEPCDLCGYHCWAEFFAPGLGWIPVDASCACKYGKRHLFGDLEMNHVAWSVGRDILLAPPQRGGRLSFFAAPYAEVAGQVHRAVNPGIRFTLEAT